MQILYLGLNNTPYGSRSHEVRIAESLARLGEEVTLCCEREVNFEGDVKPENLDIRILPVTKLSWLQMRKICRKKFDIVFGSCIMVTPATIKLGKRLSLPVVNQLFDIPMWRLNIPYYKKIWNGWLKELVISDAIVVITQVTEKDLAKLIPLPTNIFYLPYSIDKTTIDGIIDQEEDNQAIIVSRLEPHRNVDLALEAVSLVSHPSRLVIIGEGSERKKLEKIAKEKKIDALFLGAISDRDKILEMKKSKFMIYPSANEHIFGLAPLEALYCKKPCICFEVEVLKGVLGNSVDYVAKGDVTALAKRIDFLNTNPGYRKERGKRGKEYVNSGFTNRIRAEKLRKLFTDIIQGK